MIKENLKNVENAVEEILINNPELTTDEVIVKLSKELHFQRIMPNYPMDNMCKLFVDDLRWLLEKRTKSEAIWELATYWHVTKKDEVFDDRFGNAGC